MIPSSFWTYRVGVHPPHERNFFVISEAVQWTKFHQAHFQVKTTHSSSFCSCSNNSFWIGTKLYRQIFFGILINFLVSQVRDTIKPWNVWKYVSLTKEVDWLACKLHTSHVTQSVTLLIVIIAQGIPLVQISSSYQKLRY